MRRDGCGVQGLGGRKPPKVARPVAQEQRADSRRIVRSPRHNAAGGDQTSPAVGSGKPGGRRLAGARETALSQSRADSRDLRALDWQIRTPSPPGVERSEKRSRSKPTKEERLT